MSVASEASVIVASVVASVLPASRNETGIATTSDLAGTPPRVLRYSRSAPPTSVSTTSFNVASFALDSWRTAASGSDAVAKLRPASIVRLNAVRGPRLRLRRKPVEPVASLAAARARPGSSRTRFTVCEPLTLSAVPIRATTPGCSVRRRRAGSTARGVGAKSSMACAKATPEAPSRVA